MADRETPIPVRVIDSHTAGEPTRIVVAGAPDLGVGDMASRLATMRAGSDWLRTALVCEPRGAEWMVGAVLQEPVDPECAAGVIFFNNAGYLGMCGHGTIGVVETLRHLGRIGPGWHRIETPVGEVRAFLADSGDASIENVVSRRTQHDVAVALPDGTEIVGDVAWGGNWFFLTEYAGPLELAYVDELTRMTLQIRQAIAAAGVVGDGGATIDHIVLFGQPRNATCADGRNFVLCPGGFYDRSPCGTGLSAKLACLAADGKLAPGTLWRQESVIDTLFTAHYREAPGGVIPTITARAYVNGDLTLVVDPRDPFRHGIFPNG